MMPLAVVKGEMYGISSSTMVIKFSKRHVSNATKINSSQYLIQMIDHCIAHNTKSMPVIINKGKGIYLYDVEEKEYMDFLSGHTIISLGHCHPKLCKALVDQAFQLEHVTRAFNTKVLADFGDYLTDLFCYDKVLPTNSACDALESSIKIARNWGYKIKGIRRNQAKVLFAENASWGPSIAAISFLDDPYLNENYGPYAFGFETLPFSDAETLESRIADPSICALVLEPIMSDAGVILPDPCYLKRVRELCTQKKVLFITDESKTGLGRCGAMLACDIYRVRPDIVILSKALTSGFIPFGAVLADSEIMDVMEPDIQDSGFGGHPIGCKLTIETLRTLQEEDLIENSKNMGELLRDCLSDLPKDVVSEIRGLGLMNAIVLKKDFTAFDLCLNMLEQGLLTSPIKRNIIPLHPPLIIKEKEILKAAHIIRNCIENVRGKVKKDRSTLSSF